MDSPSDGEIAVTWTAMIQAYGTHGFAKEALQLFEKMQTIVKPSSTTLICVLNACSHVGWVEQAWDIYHNMKEKFGIEPLMQHQACMVDVLGRYIKY